MPLRSSSAFVALTLAITVGCVPAQRGEKTSPPASKPARSVDHADWHAILRANVRDERFDYLALRHGDWKKLDGYLDSLARVDVAKLSERERLAYYLNIYNATMVRTIAGRLVDGFTAAANGYGVFKEKLVRLRSGRVSLDHIENGIIRKQFDEPRIHVALVCGARSCPPLINEAFTADKLDGQLERNMKAFINGGERNQIDMRRRKLKLSKIFDWYKVDFGGDAGVPGYVAGYAEAGSGVAGYAVEYLEYSWQLNLAAPVKGERYVVLTKDGKAGRKGDVVRAILQDGDALTVERAFGKGRVTISARAAKPLTQ